MSALPNSVPVFRPTRRRLLGAAGSAGAAAYLAACSSSNSSSKPAATTGAARATAVATPASASVQPAVDPSSLIPDGIKKYYPRIAEYHWSKMTFSKNQPKYGGTYRQENVSDNPTWDPTDPGFNSYCYNFQLFFNRLVRPDMSFETAFQNKRNFFKILITNDLVASWAQPDQLTYTFKLQPGVKFHNMEPTNGLELTSDDVKFSFDAYSQPTAAAQYPIFRDVDSITTLDKYTVQIKTKKPTAYLMYSLVGPLTIIFSRLAYEKQGGLKSALPTGTGPFILDKHEFRNITSGHKNPEYFVKGRPYLDAVELHWIPDPAAKVAAFRTGQIDTMTCQNGWDQFEQVLSTERGKMDVNVFQQNSLGQPHFGVYHNKPPFNDIRVRQGVSMALDRDGMVKARYKEGRWSIGIPTDWTGKDYPSIPSEFGPNFAHNPAEAKKMLAAAGASDLSWPITVSTSTGQPDDLVALAVEYWKQIGLKPEIKVLDAVAFNQGYFGKQFSGMLFGASITGGTDLNDFTYRNLRTGEVTNYYGISDPQLDSLLDAQQAAFDRSQREGIGGQILQREFDQLNRIWAASYLLPDLKRPYVQGGYISHDVYFWANALGLYQLADVWLDK